MPHLVISLRRWIAVDYRSRSARIARTLHTHWETTDVLWGTIALQADVVLNVLDIDAILIPGADTEVRGAFRHTISRACEQAGDEEVRSLVPHVGIVPSDLPL